MARNVVGARELKTRLGTHLQRVREGRTLVVTERGESVAELRPLPSDGSLPSALCRKGGGKLSEGEGSPAVAGQGRIRGIQSTSTPLNAAYPQPPGESRADDCGYRTKDEKRPLEPERGARADRQHRACRGKREEGEQSRRPETD